MSGINIKRVLLGGVTAGLIVFVCEGVAGMFYGEQMAAALAEMGKSMAMSASTPILIILSCFLSGIVAVFFYAAARPRLGPGPKTAAMVVAGMFLGGFVPSLIAYHIMGLFPFSLLMIWAVVGLLDTMLGVMVGCWLYREA